MFFACFLHRRKSISNESKHRETFCGFFMDQKTPDGPEQLLGGAPRGAQPTRARLGAQACPGGLCPPRWPPAPPLCPINSQIFQKPSGNHILEVPPPQGYVATRNQSRPHSGTPPEGEIIIGGHLHHPGGHHDEEGVVHPRG